MDPITTVTPITTGRLLNTREAAAKLGVSEQFLAADRCTRRHGIPFVCIGRTRKYRDLDLDRFIASNLVGAEAA